MWISGTMLRFRQTQSVNGIVIAHLFLNLVTTGCGVCQLAFFCRLSELIRSMMELKTRAKFIHLH